MIIRNALAILPQGRRKADVAVKGDKIERIGESLPGAKGELEVDAEGLWLLPGAIDTHVHFRDPGMTQKGDLATESRQAVMGGVTSYMDMPNTRPSTTTLETWEAKMARAAEVSAANYAFFLGAASDNLGQLRRADWRRVPGVKVFMGASTGDMLMDDDSKLRELFGLGVPVAVHAEDQKILDASRAAVKAEFGDAPVPYFFHKDLRPAAACVAAMGRAVEAAASTGGRLHVLHLSSRDEVELAQRARREHQELKLTLETCPHYLMFWDKDYDALGPRIKCNPSIKTRTDREALIDGVFQGQIDVIGSDHAPHLLADKDGDALTAASGMPGVRFTLPLLLTMGFEPEAVARLTATRPAEVYGVKGRGAISVGNFADLVLVNPRADVEVADAMIDAPCGWTPYAGVRLTHAVQMTIVNGQIAHEAGAPASAIPALGLPLEFER